MNTIIESKANRLADAWKGIQQAKPHQRIREAAKELGVSEAELLATKVGDNVVRLKNSWPELLTSFKTLGRVMSLTRNDSCILEHKGTFQEIDIMANGAMATVIGPIELRVFFTAWKFAFAVVEEKQDRVLKSIQVFDQAGEAIIKVYLQEKSNVEAFEKIIADFRAEEQSPELDVKSYSEETYATDVDANAFVTEWSNLKDTHDFFGLVRKYKLHRYHAIELASDKFTYQVNAQKSLKQILDVAAETKLPIMIFVGNKGNIQIHQGKVRTIRVLEQGHGGNWLNVLDPDFNMHLRMDDVHTAWVVKKPTTEGNVTSIEVFDKDKNMIAQFFGLRKPGIPEKEEWRALVEKLSAL